MTFRTLAHLREPLAPGNGAVAVLPLGAMETHGPHLPLGTDGLIAEGIIEQAARGFTDGEVYRLPLLWLGASAEHAHRAGTISREPEGLIGDIVSVGEGLHRLNIRRVVLFNGHGGNVAAASIAALKLRTRFGLLAASAHWLDFGLPAGITVPTPATGDVHGGWIETSVMLHLAPELVDRAVAKDQPARTPAPLLFPTGPIAWGWTSDDLGGSAIGHPEKAEARLGAALVGHAAQGLRTLLAQLAAASWPQS